MNEQLLIISVEVEQRNKANSLIHQEIMQQRLSVQNNLVD